MFRKRLITVFAVYPLYLYPSLCFELSNFLFAVLDDTFAEVHSDGDAVNGDSIVFKNGGYVEQLKEVDGTTLASDVIDDLIESFTLTYDESAGRITLNRFNDLNRFSIDKTYLFDDADTPVDVSHVMISSSGLDVASWRICGMGKNRVR